MRTNNYFRLLKHHSILFLILLATICFFTGCRTNEPLSRTSVFFDTFITITIYDKDADIGLLDECMEKAAYFESCFSPTKENSDVWAINHRSVDTVSVHEETAELINSALEYCEASSGLIDISIEPAARLWDFSSENADNHQIPSPDAIDNVLPHIDYRTISVNGTKITLKDPESQISLGFIAKGYIADQMKEYLLSKGVKKALINLGGNILAVGTKPDGSPFKIGVQKPFDEKGTSITTLEVNNQSLVSSGIYERCFYDNNKLYHHILNPQNGYPIDNELYQVTILSDSSMQGDALSTTCYVLGLKKGLKLIEQTPNAEAVFVTNTYEIIKSSGL